MNRDDLDNIVYAANLISAVAISLGIRVVAGRLIYEHLYRAIYGAPVDVPAVRELPQAPDTEAVTQAELL